MGNAARSAGPAAVCSRALRDASGEDAWRAARDALAGTLRTEALRVLVLNGIPAQARDDLAQAVTLTVLDRIVCGSVEPGFEDGYVAVAAKNRARDWHREQSGVFEKMKRCEDEPLRAPDLDPHAALERAEDDQQMRRLSERVARALEAAPARYREALVAVYLHGVPIDTLAERELFREWPWSEEGGEGDYDPIGARRRARARVDKLLQRARDWLRARLTAEEVTQ